MDNILNIALTYSKKNLRNLRISAGEKNQSLRELTR